MLSTLKSLVSSLPRTTVFRLVRHFKVVETSSTFSTARVERSRVSISRLTKSPRSSIL
ncbi:hypothetical protein EVA_19356 [gut metagenome]|uniref:Uncharacterized protein n=1 Tax=gut metagenome TaxID=749906 RepID=J9FCF0_9ZZZZ